MFFKRKKLSENEFAAKFIITLQKKIKRIEVILINDLEIITKYKGGENKHFLDNAYSEYSRESKDLKILLINMLMLQLQCTLKQKGLLP
jgi:hypothetical protein